MQVNNDLKSIGTRPSDGLLKIGQLTGDIRLARTDFKSPITDGDADVVQPKRPMNA